MPLPGYFSRLSSIPIGFYETAQQRLDRLREAAQRLAEERARRERLDVEAQQQAQEHFREVQQQQAVEQAQEQRRRSIFTPRFSEGQEFNPPPPEEPRRRSFFSKLGSAAESVGRGAVDIAESAPRTGLRAAEAVPEVAGTAAEEVGSQAGSFLRRATMNQPNRGAIDTGERSTISRSSSFLVPSFNAALDVIDIPRSKLVKPALEEVLPDKPLLGRSGGVLGQLQDVQKKSNISDAEALSYILDPTNLVFFGGKAGRVAQVARKALRGEELIASEARIAETAIKRASILKETGTAASEAAKPIEEIGQPVVKREGHRYRAFDKPEEALGSDVSSSSEPFAHGGPYEIEFKGGSGRALGPGHPGDLRGSVQADDVTRVFVEPDAWTPESKTQRLAEDLPKLRKMFPQARFVGVELADDAETRIVRPLEEQITSPWKKVTQALKSAGEATPEQQVMFAAERRRRVGIAAGTFESELAKGKSVDEASAIARSTEKGRFPRPKFEAPEFTTADAEAIKQDIVSAKQPYYTTQKALQAFNELANGVIPQPAYRKILRDISPDAAELVDVLESKIKTVPKGYIGDVPRRRVPMTLAEKTVNEAVSLIGLPVKIMTSYDFGTMLRQGAIMGWAHPKEWLSTIKPMFRAQFSEKAAQEAMAVMRKSPFYGLSGGEVSKGIPLKIAYAAENPKLPETSEKAMAQWFRDRGFKVLRGEVKIGGTDIGVHPYAWGDFVAGSERVPTRSSANPSFVNSISNKLFPGMLGSERNAAVQLNKMGFDTYASVAQAMLDSGELRPSRFKALAQPINHGRGYGSFNPGQIAKGINAFFSARNFVARLQVLIDPLVQPGSLFKPSARQLAAKNLVSMVAGDLSLVGFIGAIGAATGVASVEFNPMKPGADWLKVKVGNTRFDPWSGFTPLARLITHMGAAAATETGLANSQYDLGEVKKELGNFFSNKEAPVVRLFTDAVGMSESFGKEALSTSRLVEMFTPFVSQDIYDAVKHADWGVGIPAKVVAGAVTGAVSETGIGTQTYEPSDYSKFAEAFKTKTGKDYTPTLENKDIVASSPDLKALFDKSNTSSLERGFQGAESIQTIRDYQISKETELLPAAQRALAGDQDALTNWQKLRGDYLTAKAEFSKGIYADLEKKDPSNEELKLQAEYSLIAPKVLPDGTYDWDKFEADRNSKLAEMRVKGYSGNAAALEKNRDHFIDPTLNKLDAKYQIAADTRDKLFDISKYVTASGKPVSVKESQAIDDFSFQLADMRAKWITKYRLPYLDEKTTAKALAEKLKDPALYQWYLALNKDYDKHINPAYSSFLKRNQSVLDPFFHKYYDSISELRRWGIEAEPPPQGLRKPKKPERPQALTYAGELREKQRTRELKTIRSGGY